jgi:hypothetical protein
MGEAWCSTWVEPGGGKQGRQNILDFYYYLVFIYKINYILSFDPPY